MQFCYREVGGSTRVLSGIWPLSHHPSASIKVICFAARYSISVGEQIIEIATRELNLQWLLPYLTSTMPRVIVAGQSASEPLSVRTVMILTIVVASTR